MTPEKQRQLVAELIGADPADVNPDDYLLLPGAVFAVPQEGWEFKGHIDGFKVWRTAK